MRPDLSSIDPGPRCPGVVRMIVEIPKNSHSKYECDRELGVFRLDRSLYSPVHYPGDYGFIPGTLAEDGDPADILSLVDDPAYPGVLVLVRPIGVLLMKDQGGRDGKILAVPDRDPRFDQVRTMDDIFAHIRREIEYFFTIYKELEGKSTEEPPDGARWNAACWHFLRQEVTMPEKKTLDRAKEDAREGKSPSTQAGEFVREEMDHIREGKHGARNTKQAIAIGLSKARQLRPPRKGAAPDRTRSRAQRDNAKAQESPGRKPSATRSRAASGALRREGHAAASRSSLSRQAKSGARTRTAADRSRAARKAARTRARHR